MKIWLVSAGWDHEGAIVVAVCTTEELAEKAKAVVDASHRSFDYCEIQCAETDAFNVSWNKAGEPWFHEIGDPGNHIPIVEYQKDRAV